MIKVNNLYKNFGEVQALNGLSFTALDGEITGVLGPNGAGKTTCLRILYALLKADQGDVVIDGIVVVDVVIDFVVVVDGRLLVVGEEEVVVVVHGIVVVGGLVELVVVDCNVVVVVVEEILSSNQ